MDFELLPEKFFKKLFNTKLLEEDQFSDCKCDNTWDCNLVNFDLPMCKFVISEIMTDWNSVESFIKLHINEYPFVKTCEFSPKDWKDPPIFTNSIDAMKALQNSSRCFLNRHIVMKEERKYISQARCFWSSDKLRIICGNMSKEKVLDFFRIYSDNIPFHYCCVELGEYENKVEVIEINTFSQKCDPAPFSWSQDWEKLFFSEQVIYNFL